MDFSYFLKTSTRAAHQEVENNYPMNCLMQTNISKRDYRRVLLTLHSLHRILEPGLERLVQAPDFTRFTTSLQRQICATGLLLQDIRQLREGEHSGSEEVLQPEPEISTPGEWLGALYVLEGSCLGGRLILKWLESLGEDAPLPSRYYQHSASPANWPGFRAQLCAWVSDDKVRAREVVTGAQKTFKCLHNIQKHWES